MKELVISAPKEHLLGTLENSRNYSMAVATAMPADQYDFKAVETAWSFGELVHHIAYGIHWWEDNFIKGKKTEWNPPALTGSKQEATSYLDSAYNALKETILRKNLTSEVLHGFHSTLDHITHHRGQLVLLLRVKGIVPPEYMY
jgi:uncharacterized damage-inducible protein DinB